MDALKQKEPEIAFDGAKLRTEEDWIRAGQIVFRAAREYQPAGTGIGVNPDAVRSLRIPATRDGLMPFFQYVVRKKGAVELGLVSCGGWHTRVMPDGTGRGRGAGEFSVARRDALARISDNRPDPDRRAIALERMLYAAPWTGRADDLYATTRAEQIRRLQATQSGVIAREGTSSAYPAHVPSLIGIKDRRYLDATGLARHRSIADLMRYAVVNQGFVDGLQVTAHYGDFSRRI
jgi:hypothetical protein